MKWITAPPRNLNLSYDFFCNGTLFLGLVIFWEGLIRYDLCVKASNEKTGLGFIDNFGQPILLGKMLLLFLFYKIIK